MPRRLRFLALALLSFIATFLGNLFAPGHLLNRLFAVALCTLLSADTVCQTNLAQPISGRILAANPAVVEPIAQNDPQLAQRSREFDDDYDDPPPSSTQTAPPYPYEPGPNQPLRRPDFDDSIPIEKQNDTYGSLSQLLGIWAYSFYTDPTETNPFLMIAIKILNQDGNPSFSVCDDTSCGQYVVTDSQFNNHQPNDKVITLEYGDSISEQFVSSIDQKAYWQKLIVRNKSEDQSLYIFAEKGFLQQKMEFLGSLKN